MILPSCYTKVVISDLGNYLPAAVCSFVNKLVMPTRTVAFVKKGLRIAHCNEAILAALCFILINLDLFQSPLCRTLLKAAVDYLVISSFLGRNHLIYFKSNFNSKQKISK